MIGSEFRELRERMRLTRYEASKVIGLTGTYRNNVNRVKAYEASDQVPLYIARLWWLIHHHWDYYGEIPPFPAWAGYEFEHTPDPGHLKKRTP